MNKLLKFTSISLLASMYLHAGGKYINIPAYATVASVINQQYTNMYFGGAINRIGTAVSSQAEACNACTYDKENQTGTKGTTKLIEWGGGGHTYSAIGIVGYELNEYIAIDTRFTTSLSSLKIKDHKPIDYSNAAIYLKPQYKFGNSAIYGLVGYGASSVNFMDSDTVKKGLQYGAGASYGVSDNFSLFADYTKVQNGDSSISEATTLEGVDSINFGLIFRP